MTIIGTAAGVPFTALPPAGSGPAPLVVTWHMMDAPCTDWFTTHLTEVLIRGGDSRFDNVTDARLRVTPLTE